jgi:hypothetical protein
LDNKISFCSGISGIGWLLTYIRQQKYINDINTDVILCEIDNYIINNLKDYLLINYWDFLHGYIGVGCYLLDRMHNNIVEPVILSILERLENSAIVNKNTIKWKSIINWKDQTFRYNISLSHGICGVLLFLLKLFEKGIKKERVLYLINGSVNYLLSQKINYQKYNSFFPMFSVESENELQGSRLSWCYGDLGICFALWKTGIVLNDTDLQSQSLDMLLLEAQYRRNLNDAGVKDACFCHGTVGIAHIFYKMFHYTKDSRFAEAANFWYKETLKMSIFVDGLAGYKDYYDKEKGYVNQYDLLNGIAGIAMSLMFFHKSKYPDFDDCFLLN